MNAKLLTALYRVRSDLALASAQPSSITSSAWTRAVQSTPDLWNECLDVLGDAPVPSVPATVALCEKSRERLIAQYTPYLHSVALKLLRQYPKSTMTHSEVASEVTLGFLRSVEKYDARVAEERGARFLTYSRHYCEAYGRRGIQERQVSTNVCKMRTQAPFLTLFARFRTLFAPLII